MIYFGFLGFDGACRCVINGNGMAVINVIMLRVL